MFSLQKYNNSNNRSNGFYANYLKICKKNNLPPIADIKCKSKLDIYVDRLRIDDLLTIIKSLKGDETLELISIKARKSIRSVLEKINSDKKCRSMKGDGIIASKFVFPELINAIAGTFQFNKLKELQLEGMPLFSKYLQNLTKCLAVNTSITQISLARCCLMDEGCEIICSTVKHLPNIEKLNLSSCDITSNGAFFISEMIKFQKIYRYSEGWKQSLRYREVIADSIPGLRYLLLNNNPEIGDAGIEMITNVLKDDVWIKGIEMQNCGLTDVGGQEIIDCFNFNSTLLEFNIKNNKITDQIQCAIKKKLGNVSEEDNRAVEKVESVDELKENLAYLENQLQFEIYNRKQVEALNEQLHKQMMDYQNDAVEGVDGQFSVPLGYLLIEENVLNNLLKEIEDLKMSSDSNGTSPGTIVPVASVARRKVNVRKSQSEAIVGRCVNSNRKVSKSQSKIEKGAENKRRFIHTQISSKTYEPTSDCNIGDTTARNEPNLVVNLNEQADLQFAMMHKVKEMQDLLSHRQLQDYNYFSSNENQNTAMSLFMKPKKCATGKRFNHSDDDSSSTSSSSNEIGL